MYNSTNKRGWQSDTESWISLTGINSTCVQHMATVCINPPATQLPCFLSFFLFNWFSNYYFLGNRGYSFHCIFYLVCIACTWKHLNPWVNDWLKELAALLYNVSLMCVVLLNILNTFHINMISKPGWIRPGFSWAESKKRRTCIASHLTYFGQWLIVSGSLLQQSNV